jgi:MOSC domain-containing protein YiiM
MQTVHDYLDTLPQVGRVEWIGLSPGRRQPIVPVEQALVRVGTGLEDDYHALGGQSHRQVTLIQFEHLGVIASLVGRACVTPDLLRRNIAVQGINLLALRERRFRIGEAILEGTGPCDPCSRMEDNLGPGGLNAMRGHGGITARVLVEGTIRAGDTVELLPLASREVQPGEPPA